MENTPYKGKGLLPLPKDDRDLLRSQVFGSVSLNDLPTHDFLVATPLEIKNQDVNYPSDYCTAYGAAACAEDEDQVIFVPEYTFAGAKWLLQKDGQTNAVNEYGLNLRDICQAAVNVGFLPRTYDPFKCDSMGRPTRQFLGNFMNWSHTLLDEALKYKKRSFFLVDGPHDTFDNFRATMWRSLGDRRSILTGAIWRNSWSTAPDGIIPKVYESSGSGHAFKICGQKTINGEIRLIAQLSEGPEFGDNGFCYFTRAQVNQEFKAFGAFTFEDLTIEEALRHVTSGVTIYDSIPVKILKYLRFISKYIKI